MAARKRKTPAPAAPAAPAQPAMTAEEQQLAEKYMRDIVPQSLAAAGAHPEHGKKRTLEIRCMACGEHRRLATSDLFQCKYCVPCTAAARKAARKAKKAPAE